MAVPPLVTSCLSDPPPPPQAAARNETSGMDMPTTVPRRTNSRRVILPAEYSSMMWFSSSLRSLRMASTRRWVSSITAFLLPPGCGLRFRPERSLIAHPRAIINALRSLSGGQTRGFRRSWRKGAKALQEQGSESRPRRCPRPRERWDRGRTFADACRRPCARGRALRRCPPRRAAPPTVRKSGRKTCASATASWIGAPPWSYASL